MNRGPLVRFCHGKKIKRQSERLVSDVGRKICIESYDAGGLAVQPVAFDEAVRINLLRIGGGQQSGGLTGGKAGVKIRGVGRVERIVEQDGVHESAGSCCSDNNHFLRDGAGAVRGDQHVGVGSQRLQHINRTDG